MGIAVAFAHAGIRTSRDKDRTSGREPTGGELPDGEERRRGGEHTLGGRGGRALPRRPVRRDKKEVHAVLAAVPASVDRAFMASLHAALNENRKIVFKWEEHRDLTFEHAVQTDGDTSVLTLRTPHPSKLP